MANGTQEDTSFLEKYKVPPQEGEDTSFLEKYRAKPTATALRPPPTMGAEATGIGPRRTGIYSAGTGAGPIESRVEDFLNPTTMYKKEHPILGGIGEGLRNLRETFTPGVMAAATLMGGPGGIEGEIGPNVPKRASLPAMSLPGGRLPRVSTEPRPTAGMPKTVFEEPLQLGPVPKSEQMNIPPQTRGKAVMEAPPATAPKMAGGAQLAESESNIDIVESGTGKILKSYKNTPQGKQLAEQDLPRWQALQSEPMQVKPLGERRLGEAGRKPTVEDVVNRATGVKPLQRNVPLREQMKAPTSTEETDPIKMKYPDPEIRQMVRSEGARMYEAAKNDPATLKAIHDLTRVDLRQALMNAGEDMGQRTVSNSKFAGEGSIGRSQAFDKLLDKGLSPKRILELSKAPLMEKK